MLKEKKKTKKKELRARALGKCNVVVVEKQPSAFCTHSLSFSCVQARASAKSLERAFCFLSVSLCLALSSFF